MLQDVWHRRSNEWNQALRNEGRSSISSRSAVELADPRYSRTADMLQSARGPREGRGRRAYVPPPGARKIQSARDLHGRRQSGVSAASLATDSSVSSCCPTPVAGKLKLSIGRPWGGDGLLGGGRLHRAEKCHFSQIGIADCEKPGLHGHSGDADMQDGMERFIGHGKHFSGPYPTAMKGALVLNCPAPGEHGHPKMDDFDSGMERYVGHGRKKYPATQYKDHWNEDADTVVGGHGHRRNDDCKDGLDWCIGHGKRKLRPSHKAQSWKNDGTSPTSLRGSFVDGRAAGLSSRDVALQSFIKDPRSQGTHQDRRINRMIAARGMA